MIHVAITWQIYEITNSALHLGLVGLVLFVPVIAGTFIIGHVADHYDRRWVIAVCQVSKGLGALILLLADYTGYLSVGVIYFVVFIVGAGRAFEGPTMHTIPPSIMPQEVLSRAIAAGATAHQVAVIGGPALGGFLLALGSEFRLRDLLRAVCDRRHTDLPGSHPAAGESEEGRYPGIGLCRLPLISAPERSSSAPSRWISPPC